MKVYVALFVPYGELKNDCSVEILGVFATRKEAADHVYNGTVEPDIIFDDYRIDFKELNEFIKGTSNNIDVYFKKYENYNCYYQVHIVEKEVTL